VTLPPSPLDDEIARVREDAALFVDDDTLHRKVAPYMGRDSFRALLKVWEAEGFPKKKSSVRGRYWSACQAWLDKKYGVGSDALDDDAQDGPEHLNASTRERAGPQEGPPRANVLVRGERGAGREGIPRHLHPVAGGRERR
jgi:hypothetical protein